MASNSPDYYLCIILCNSDSGLIHYAYLRSGHDLCNTHTTGHHLLSESILYLSVVLMRQTATGDLVDQQRKLGSALCVVAAEAHHGAAGTGNMSCAKSDSHHLGCQQMLGLPLSSLLHCSPQLQTQRICQGHRHSIPYLAVLIVHIAIELELIRESLHYIRLVSDKEDSHTTCQPSSIPKAGMLKWMSIFCSSRATEEFLFITRHAG